MYVTPPDTDVYAIPKVLAPMPQKVVLDILQVHDFILIFVIPCSWFNNQSIFECLYIDKWCIIFIVVY